MHGNPLHKRGMLVPAGSGQRPGSPRGGVGNPAPQASKTLRSINPLQPLPGAEIPFGQPGEATRDTFDAKRVTLAGGSFQGDILHPALSPFEQLYRRLPEEGMFDPAVSPSNPFTFELGAFTVPDTMSLLLFDLRPDIYRFSGVDPGDFVPIESRRFGSIMGFDITVDNEHKGNIRFELDPVAIQRTSQQAFNNNNQINPTFNQGQRAIGKSSSFASSSGMGNALQPQRHERYGALSIPFTIFARTRQTVQVQCVIFRPIPAPIAFIEYDIAGVLVPELWMDEMLNAVKPPTPSNKESIR